jgi:serine/threonine protein kinase
MTDVIRPEVPPQKNSCMECDAPLGSVALGGLCPKCLLKLGLHHTAPPEAIGMAGAKQILAPPQFPFDFGGYRIWKLLGRGGMGAVYEADQLSSGRRVALKVLGHTFGIPEARKRFLREGTLAAKVNHPQSVYVFGTEEIEGTPVIVMELVRGGTLKDRLRSGPMEPSAAVDAILQVVAGLEAAAKQGVLHRDIKPANCFQSVEGEVKVGDYGNGT